MFYLSDTIALPLEINRTKASKTFLVNASLAEFLDANWRLMKTNLADYILSKWLEFFFEK